MQRYLGLLILAACGAPPAAAAPPSEAKVETSPAPPGLTARKDEFMGACRGDLSGADAYCSCSWKLLLEVAGEEAVAADTTTPADLDTFESKLADACASELPVETIRAQWIAGCAKNHAAMASFCQCTWNELTAELPAETIARRAAHATPELAAARERARVACEPLAAEAKAEIGFMEGCVTQPEVSDFCGCAWKVIRENVSHEVIAAGEADVEALKPQVRERCASLLPAAPPAP
ncbi:MAG: hypothetical protein R3B72_03935 [Polyangiaceae bacterium]